MSRCTACLLPMIVVDGHTTHPACDTSDPNAALIRQQHEARRLAVAGQQQAIVTAPTDHAAAIEIIRQAATTMRVFGSNDCRAFPGWESLHPPVRGAAFTSALRRGWIEPQSYEASSSTATHGHRVATYRSRIYAEQATA